jgi:mycofactocin precursor
LTRVVEALIPDRNIMEPNQQNDVDAPAEEPVASDTELVTEILVEEVSIDGMCGVY